MINFNNLRLFYACREWIRLQSLYDDVNNIGLLIQIRKQELHIRSIVQDIERTLEQERKRVDPLA